MKYQKLSFSNVELWVDLTCDIDRLISVQKCVSSSATIFSVPFYVRKYSAFSKDLKLSLIEVYGTTEQW